MARKAKLKSTGELIEVYAEMDCLDDVVWINPSTKSEYHSDELEFLKDAVTTSQSHKFLSLFTDEELKEELKRRKKENQSKFPPNVRCRDCKYCGAGFTYRHQVYSSTVCLALPKPSQGVGRFYSTSGSNRVCEKFVSK